MLGIELKGWDMMTVLIHLAQTVSRLMLLKTGLSPPLR